MTIPSNIASVYHRSEPLEAQPWGAAESDWTGRLRLRLHPPYTIPPPPSTPFAINLGNVVEWSRNNEKTSCVSCLLLYAHRLHTNAAVSVRDYSKCVYNMVIGYIWYMSETYWLFYQWKQAIYTMVILHGSIHSYIVPHKTANLMEIVFVQGDEANLTSSWHQYSSNSSHCHKSMSANGRK